MTEFLKPSWEHAPEWATLHFFQSWGIGIWADEMPELGQFSHNHGRWWLPLTAKSRPSGYELPLGMDYRQSIEHRPTRVAQTRPTIVCLCGSTRFSEAYQQANLEETLKGNIVLTIGCDMRSNKELFENKSQKELIDIKNRLDELHLRKVELADEVLILNLDGYVGSSTARELEHALNLGKGIRFWEEIPEGVVE